VRYGALLDDSRVLLLTRDDARVVDLDTGQSQIHAGSFGDAVRVWADPSGKGFYAASQDGSLIRYRLDVPADEQKLDPQRIDGNISAQLLLGRLSSGPLDLAAALPDLAGLARHHARGTGVGKEGLRALHQRILSDQKDPRLNRPEIAYAYQFILATGGAEDVLRHVLENPKTFKMLFVPICVKHWLN
jgi:hypothetical protein